MLMLVTSDNLLQMFFGWEGVGLASYLLIGFWYTKPSANAAAIKAFVVNRVGDFGFALGIFGLFAVTSYHQPGRRLCRRSRSGRQWKRSTQRYSPHCVGQSSIRLTMWFSPRERKTSVGRPTTRCLAAPSDYELRFFENRTEGITERAKGRQSPNSYGRCTRSSAAFWILTGDFVGTANNECIHNREVVRVRRSGGCREPMAR